MKIIGLTGNIGSGKSCVARYLVELGAAHIDADKVGHEIYQPDTAGWKEIVDSFGKSIVNPDGTIDRKKLSQIVFNNPQEVARLNRILHPKIRKEVEKRLDRFREQGKKAAVVEATLLVEAGWMDIVDELWLVIAPKDLTLERLKIRGLSESEALSRLSAQTPPQKLAPVAKVVINNDGTLEDLKALVHNLWKQRISERP